VTLSEVLSLLGRIHLLPSGPVVCETIAKEIRRRFARKAEIRKGRVPSRLPAHALRISVGRAPVEIRDGKPWVWFDVDDRGAARLAASHARYLYAFFAWLVDVRGDRPVSRVSSRRLRRPAFAWQRPVWDLYFAQSGRTVRGMDRDAYARQMVRAGFTHLEVNGLAFPEGGEEGVPGEIYPRFYTYCPALDQFVESFLNRGVYPRAYLAANLRNLKTNCRAAAKYGLVPTMTCFEPRSVPDLLLEKYPELRGCRVDHPFRSFKPRYNLCVSHPVVKRHYREMMRRLMRAVPELGCLSIWTNDSGAGFEFTRSLYVGANGSAFLVREWSEEDAFANAAAENVTGFLRLLRDAAAEINPDFRVATRLEPFGPERAGVLAGLGRGLDVEVPTMLAEGWDSPYRHPKYADCAIGPFTVYNDAFLPEEKAEIRKLARRDGRVHVVHAHGPVNNFEPLLGIPSPWLTFAKLDALRRNGAVHLAHVGGTAPPSAVPYDVNAEVFRRFQFDARIDPEATVLEIASGWVGDAHAEVLVEAWRLAEQAIRGFMPNPLYFSWGVWYRLWTRPLVPDIEAIPEEDRAYYERHILATHHNPTRFDLSRDVLFDIMPPDVAHKAVARIDRNALPRLTEALAVLEVHHHLLEAGDDPAAAVFRDQIDRLTALSCWMTTRRNVSAWIAGVRGFMETRDRAIRAACRELLAEMIPLEIENARALLKLWNESETEFMAVSGVGETTFILGENFGENLERKVDLMERYGERPPRFDPDLMWRVAGLS
jgi:hypothetical protein